MVGEPGEEGCEDQHGDGAEQAHGTRGGTHDLGHLHRHDQPGHAAQHRHGQQQGDGRLLALAQEHHDQCGDGDQHAHPGENAVGAGQAGHDVRDVSVGQVAVLGGLFGVEGLALGGLGGEDVFGGGEDHRFSTGQGRGGLHLVHAGLSEGEGHAGSQHQADGDDHQQDGHHAQTLLLGDGIDEVGCIGGADAHDAAQGACEGQQCHQQGGEGDAAQAQLGQLAGSGGEHVTVADGHQAQDGGAYQHQRQHLAAHREPAVNGLDEAEDQREDQQRSAGQQHHAGGGGDGLDDEDTLDVGRIGGIGLQRSQITGEDIGKDGIFRADGLKVGFLAQGLVQQGEAAVHRGSVRRGGGHAVRHIHHMSGQEHQSDGDDRQHAAQQSPVAVRQGDGILLLDGEYHQDDQLRDGDHQRQPDPGLHMHQQCEQEGVTQVVHLQGEGTQQQCGGQRTCSRDDQRAALFQQGEHCGQNQQHQACNQIALTELGQRQGGLCAHGQGICSLQHHLSHGERRGELRGGLRGDLAVHLQLHQRAKQHHDGQKRRQKGQPTFFHDDPGFLMRIWRPAEAAGISQLGFRRMRTACPRWLKSSKLLSSPLRTRSHTQRSPSKWPSSTLRKLRVPFMREARMG